MAADQALALIPDELLRLSAIQIYPRLQLAELDENHPFIKDIEVNLDALMRLHVRNKRNQWAR